MTIVQSLMGKTVNNCDSLGCIKKETIKILIITRALGFVGGPSAAGDTFCHCTTVVRRFSRDSDPEVRFPLR